MKAESSELLSKKLQRSSVRHSGFIEFSLSLKSWCRLAQTTASSNKSPHECNSHCYLFCNENSIRLHLKDSKHSCAEFSWVFIQKPVSDFLLLAINVDEVILKLAFSLSYLHGIFRRRTINYFEVNDGGDK